jgi:hypothetical protein
MQLNIKRTMMITKKRLKRSIAHSVTWRNSIILKYCHVLLILAGSTGGTEFIG